MYRVPSLPVSISRDEFLKQYGSVFEVRGSAVVEMAREPEDDSRPTFWVHRFACREDAVRAALCNLESRTRADLEAARKRLHRPRRLRAALATLLSRDGRNDIEKTEDRDWLEQEIAGHEARLVEISRATAGTIPADELIDIRSFPDILTLAFAARTGDPYWTVSIDVDGENVGLSIKKGFILRVVPREIRDETGLLDLYCEGEDGARFSSKTRMANGAFRGQSNGVFHHLTRSSAEEQARRIARNVAIGIADHILPERLIKRLSA